MASLASTRELTQGTPEWFAARRSRLTASNFGTAAGISKYVSPRSLWLKITNQIEVTRNETAATQHGVDNEDKVRKMYEAISGTTVTETGFWVHPKHGWLGASPDGLVGDIGMLEIKCPVYQVHETIPGHYMAQIQGQLECADRIYCDFASWHGNTLNIWRVYRSKVYWNWLYSILKAFWFCVECQIDPSSKCPIPPEHPPPQVQIDFLYSMPPPSSRKKKKAHCNAVCSTTSKRCKVTFTVPEQNFKPLFSYVKGLSPGPVPSVPTTNRSTACLYCHIHSRKSSIPQREGSNHE